MTRSLQQYSTPLLLKPFRYVDQAKRQVGSNRETRKCAGELAVWAAGWGEPLDGARLARLAGSLCLAAGGSQLSAAMLRRAQKKARVSMRGQVMPI
jgi:hypothetical protein